MQRVIDEHQLRVCPVTEGNGKRLFAGDSGALDMKLLKQNL
jgi:hypothetical protein